MSYQVVHKDDSVYYAEDQNPKYAILSYTWGRYRGDGGFGSPVLADAEAIEISGVTWKIPRINPNKGFDREAFKNVIEAACGDLEYIWLDVACIDQDDDADDEVGCQAAIFHNASKVSIWLHQQRQEVGVTITECVEAMVLEVESADVRSGKNGRTEGLRREQIVCKFLGDPWFSSLWTLQESFLRKDATILAHDGQEAVVTWKGIKTRLDLGTLLDICNYYLNLDDPPGNFHILTQIKNAGLDSIIAENPLVLLRAARHRTCTKMNDRVLGIQQIFEVNVKEFAEQPQIILEQALSLAINIKCPTLSQAFLHAYPPRDGRPRWQARLGTFTQPRVYFANPSTSSGVELAHRNTRRGRFTGVKPGIDDTLYIPPAFHFAVQKSSPYTAIVSDGSSGFLRWTGLCFPIADLWASWRETERSRCPHGLLQGIFEGPNGSPDLNDPYINAFECSVYLDDDMISTHEHPVNLMPTDFSRFGRPLTMVLQLCRSEFEVEVLILGKIKSRAPGSAAESWMGVLVRKGKGEGVDRIGFCTWKEDIGLGGERQKRMIR